MDHSFVDGRAVHVQLLRHRKGLFAVGAHERLFACVSQSVQEQIDRRRKRSAAIGAHVALSGRRCLIGLGLLTAR